MTIYPNTDTHIFFSNLAQRVLSVIQDGSEMFDEESEFSEVLSDLEHVRVPDFSRCVQCLLDLMVLQ